MLRVSWGNPQGKCCQEPCQALQGPGFSSTGCWAVLSSPWDSDSTALA